MKDDRTRGPRFSRRTGDVPPARRVDGEGAGRGERSSGHADGARGDRPRFASAKGDGAQGDRPRFASAKDDGVRDDRSRFASAKDDGAQGNRPRFAPAKGDGAQSTPSRPVSAAPDGGKKDRPRYAGYVPGADGGGRDRQPRVEGTPGPKLPRPSTVEDADGEVDLTGGNLLTGRNPIREALRAGTPIDKLVVSEGDLSGAAREIIALAREKGIVIQKVSRQRLDGIYPAHQGMVAFVAQAEYSTVDSMLDLARERGEEPFLILLDGVTDPHNLGAVIRSAECAGAHGVIIPERRASGLTPAAAKAAAGALSYMKVARVPNLNRAIDDLKNAGVWVVAAALEGEDAFSADMTGPIALVVGSEGEGISHLTLEKCDRRVTLPIKGHIDSLNASVAAGILLYEVMRARARV